VRLSEFQRLKKFLMLAANNDNDYEAIRAFRLATEIIRTHGFTWEQVMDRRVTVVSEVEVAEPQAEVFPPEAPAPDLTEADFSLALDGASESFADTVKSIREQWRGGRGLSPRQRSVVIRAAERAVGRHPGGRVR
jgi:hypothetical protein